MHSTQIFAILNITPDSFSNSQPINSEKVITKIQKMAKQKIAVVDIGAESTRPGAVPITFQEEIDRLSQILPKSYALAQTTGIKISLDSRNYQTVKHFIKYIDIVNDVSGLKNEKMQELILKHNKQAILMHSLSIPVNKKEYIPEDINCTEYLQKWLTNNLQRLYQKGLKKEQLIFDPGIGFGLNAKQSFEVIKNIESFKKFDVKTMLGYSRKSLFKQFGETDASKRDPETHALTLYVAQKKVDYIRVHNFESCSRILKIADFL